MRFSSARRLRRPGRPGPVLGPADAPRRDGRISTLQPREHLDFILPGYQPQDAAGTVEDGVGQRHSPPLLVNAGQSDVPICNVKDRVTWHERRSMAIRSQAQMNQIQNGRHPCDLLKQSRVFPGGGLQVSFFDGHGVDLTGRQRDVSEQTLVQKRQVSIRVARRRHSFIHLHDVHVCPRHRFL